MAMTTRSEALQQVLRRENCPFALDCEASVTRNFFDRICNSTYYPNCHHFARRFGELHTPMEWLQKLAVHEYDKAAPEGVGDAATIDAGS